MRVPGTGSGWRYGADDHPDPEDRMSATTAPPAQPQTTAALSSINPSRVDIVDDFNPRTSMDDEQLRELTASVKSVGVLQPITVVRADGDRYRLVVGHRRLLAARAAKLGAIPALVYDEIDAKSQLQFAIIENLQREDMNAIDEALSYQRAITDGALTQKQLASVIGKSASHVSERLRLLKLPDDARTLLASGALPLQAAKPLGVLAALKVPTAPQITAAVAKLAADDEQLLEDLLDDPNAGLCALADEDVPKGSPFVYRLNGYSRAPSLNGHVPDEVVEQINERAARLGMSRFTTDQSDIDAARAFGCLIELETRYVPQRFITDAGFLIDRINTALDQLEARNAERAAKPGVSGTRTAPTTSSSSTRGAAPADPAAAEAARRAEREQSEQDRLAAIHANRDLGMRLAKQLGSRKFDRTIAELLARIVLAQNGDVAARGIAYTHEDQHTLTTTRLKNGKTRTTFELLEPHESRSRAEEWVLRPRSAEEVLGRLLQLLVAGVFADDRAVAKSRRTHWHMPASMQTEPVLAKLARKLLPEHFHAHAERLMPKPTPKKPAAKKQATKAATAPKDAADAS